jgi:ATP phosphoribosyltransferase
MTAEPVIVALPSKGRLKEQVDAWLADAGLTLRMAGGVRGYSATLDGFDEIQVRLASAGDIAAGLLAGEFHLGVTGEDLLREAGETMDERVMLLTALGFGRADLVVAAPKSWIDVDTMADVDDVAHLYLARTGRRLRVATKYLLQTRQFFARHGIADYRLAESGGATEGAPAAGAAELVVDITTTGATLAANGLKVLDDGLILSSQAHVAAALTATWDDGRLDVCRRLLSIIAARARGKSIARPGRRASTTALAPPSPASPFKAIRSERAESWSMAPTCSRRATPSLAPGSDRSASAIPPSYSKRRTPPSMIWRRDYRQSDEIAAIRVLTAISICRPLARRKNALGAQ